MDDELAGPDLRRMRGRPEVDRRRVRRAVLDPEALVGPPRPFTSTIANAIVFTQPGPVGLVRPVGRPLVRVNVERLVSPRPTLKGWVNVSLSPAESVTRSVAV